eukprot:463531_1
MSQHGSSPAAVAQSPEDALDFINVDHGGRQEYTAAPGRGGVEEDGGPLGLFRSSRSPITAVFHYLFKFLALFMYVFGGWISGNFVVVGVICILLLCFDFWTVKNVTGRLMVGLRWWRNDETNDWVFESHDNPSEISPADSKLFWIGLYTSLAMWIFMLVIGILKFNIQWLIIVAVGIALAIANIIGYTKCSKNAKLQVQSIVQDGASRGAMFALRNHNIGGRVFEWFSGGQDQNEAQGQTPYVQL